MRLGEKNLPWQQKEKTGALAKAKNTTGSKDYPFTVIVMCRCGGQAELSKSMTDLLSVWCYSVEILKRMPMPRLQSPLSSCHSRPLKKPSHHSVSLDIEHCLLAPFYFEGLMRHPSSFYWEHKAFLIDLKSCSQWEAVESCCSH